MADEESQWRSEPGSGFARDRERLIAAVSKVAAEHGYAGLTVEQVLGYADLPREIFALHFETKEQALLAAQEAFFERLWLEAAHACEERERWPEKVRSGLIAILEVVVEGSALARVFTVEAFAASFAVAERQFASLEDFARLLSRGRQFNPDAQSLPEMTERVLVGGVVSLVTGHLLREDPKSIVLLEAQLVEILLIPYVGVDEARRVGRS